MEGRHDDRFDAISRLVWLILREQKDRSEKISSLVRKSVTGSTLGRSTFQGAAFRHKYETMRSTKPGRSFGIAVRRGK